MVFRVMAEVDGGAENQLFAPMGCCCERLISTACVVWQRLELLDL